MHEVGIAQNLIDTVLACAHEAAAQQVERVVLRVGPQAGVDPESVCFAFSVLAEGTIAQDATVELEAGSEVSEVLVAHDHSDGQEHEQSPDSDHAIAVIAIEIT